MKNSVPTGAFFLNAINYEMNAVIKRPVRGRPKTLDRDRVIEVAMMGYWKEGPSAVSINEICKRAKVSKPGVYREFGSEDGLKHATLIAYQEMALVPLLQLLKRELPFDEALEALIGYVLQDREAHGLPHGCLHVAMCQARDQPGALTREQTDQFRRQNLQAYARWIDRAKAHGQFKAAPPTQLAALYIDAQISAAMKLQKLGEPAEEIGANLRMALSVLV